MTSRCIRKPATDSSTTTSPAISPASTGRSRNWPRPGTTRRRRAMHAAASPDSCVPTLPMRRRERSGLPARNVADLPEFGLSWRTNPQHGMRHREVQGFDLDQSSRAVTHALWRLGIQQREFVMKARDVMVSPVITVKQSCTVREVAQTFLEHRISGAPVVDDQGKLVGIVSESDLLHRSEAGTERKRSWWLLALIGEREPGHRLRQSPRLQGHRYHVARRHHCRARYAAS